MDMRFGTWNVRSLCRAGSLKTVAEELSKYKLDLVGVQEVALNQEMNIHFSMERGMEIMNYVQAFLYIRESYQQLRG
jgi:exonuclease III